jgi:hypothetical protein
MRQTVHHLCFNDDNARVDAAQGPRSAQPAQTLRYSCEASALICDANKNGDLVVGAGLHLGPGWLRGRGEEMSLQCRVLQHVDCPFRECPGKC